MGLVDLKAAGRDERAQHAADALGSLRAEGLTPPPAALADLHAVVEGSLSSEEAIERALRRHGIAPAAAKSA